MHRKERVVHEEIKNIHGKNLSLLYSEDLKLIRLAPAYDIVSTIVYETSTEKWHYVLAMSINFLT